MNSLSPSLYIPPPLSDSLFENEELMIVNSSRLHIAPPPPISPPFENRLLQVNEESLTVSSPWL